MQERLRRNPRSAVRPAAMEHSRQVPGAALSYGTDHALRGRRPSQVAGPGVEWCGAVV